MERYDYIKEMQKDIEQWIDLNEIYPNDFDTPEDAIDFLINETWNEDEITGNGAYGYDSEKQCEEYLCHNLEQLMDAYYNLGFKESEINKYFREGKLGCFLDTIIRCNLLNEVVCRVVDKWYGE